ncbi:PDZ domain-containing protein [candidate division WOR-3 bacterium]|nr:PDZ domain-containing protein [candidate division WOR-3 bacterium]
MSPAMLIALGIEHGVLISDVIENSPAVKAGIRTGDVIVEFDGKPVHDIDSLRKIVRARPGVVVEMVIVRQLKRLKIKVQIGIRSGVMSSKTEFKPQFPLRDIYRSLLEIFKKVEPQLQTGKMMYQQSLDSIRVEIERLKKELEALKEKLEAEKIER